MQNFPTNFSPMSPPPIQKKDRGWRLTTMLLSTTFGSVVWTLLLVMGGAAVERNLDPADLHRVSRLLAFFTFVQLANLACIGGIWAWKKWGVYGSLMMHVIGVMTFIKLHGSFPTIPFIWSTVFFFSIFMRFQMFED